MAGVTSEAMTRSVSTLISLCYADQSVKCPLYTTVEESCHNKWSDLIRAECDEQQLFSLNIIY